MRPIIALLLLVSPAFAKPCRVVVQKQIVVANQVAVPFAVPVGVPVATSTPGGAFYSAGAYASPAAPPTSSLAAVAAGDAELFQEFMAWKAQRVQAQGKPSLVTQHCASCHGDHGKPAALERWKVTDIESDYGRLWAIQNIVKGAMPKGKQLDPDTMGKLIEELSEVKPEPPKAQLVPPPEPMPPKPQKESE